MDSSTFLEWLRAIYPVLVTLISLAGFVLVLWLGTKFASKKDVEQINAKLDGLASKKSVTELCGVVDSHDKKVALLEQSINAEPTRQQLHDELSVLASRMSGLEQGVRGMGDQLRTTNQYLHTIIEKSVPPATGGR